MKTRSVSVQEFKLPLVDGYRIAGESITTANLFVVTVETDTGIAGHGSAAPAVEVTGESDAICRDALAGSLSDYLHNMPLKPDPSALGLGLLDIAADAPAACAAIDMALWDIVAQAAKQPLVRYMGGVPKPMPTSVTIGICDIEQTLHQAERWIADGFRILKIKTGDDVALDIERVRKIREAFAPDVVLRIDANQGYDLRDARRFLAATGDMNIELFEQPVAGSNLRDARSLVRDSAVPIIADESAVSISDGERLIDCRAAHGINIKLMKCGGISAAAVMHDNARAAGMSIMLGCNDETRLSIAAALHFAQAKPGVRYIDLDGHMDLAKDPSAGGFHIFDGRMQLTDRPGLGITVSA